MTIIISTTIPAIKPNKKYTGGVRLFSDIASVAIDCTGGPFIVVLAEKTIDMSLTACILGTVD